jgi:hypothetical protein
MTMCPTGCGCRCLYEDEDAPAAWRDSTPVLVRSPEAVAERNEIEGWGAYEGEYLW